MDGWGCGGVGWGRGIHCSDAAHTRAGADTAFLRCGKLTTQHSMQDGSCSFAVQSGLWWGRPLPLPTHLLVPLRLPEGPEGVHNRRCLLCARLIAIKPGVHPQHAAQRRARRGRLLPEVHAGPRVDGETDDAAVAAWRVRAASQGGRAGCAPSIMARQAPVAWQPMKGSPAILRCCTVQGYRFV